MRYRYDMSRPQFDAVTAVELGDLDRGYSAIDITGKDQRLYSLTCPLMLGVFVVTIPKVTKGKMAFAAKNKTGKPLAKRLEAIELPQNWLPKHPARWTSSIDTGTERTRQRSRNAGDLDCIPSLRSATRVDCPRSRSMRVLEVGRSKPPTA
jgi:hypothetical protein